MPHLTLEYSQNLAPFPEAEVLHAVNATLCAHPEVAQESDLKTRTVPVASFAIGTQPERRAFVHAQLRLLSGRTPEAKQALSALVLQALRPLVPRPDGVAVQLSVEVVDMDRASYQKERL